MDNIKDFIYLDIDKLSSLYSQLIDGFVQYSEETVINSSDNRNIRNYNFKIFRHEAGSVEADSRQLKEVRVGHHDVYNRLEKELYCKGFIVDVGTDVVREDIFSGVASSVFEDTLCVKAEGRIVLEDYERMTRIAENYQETTKFVNYSIRNNLLELPEIKKIIQQIDDIKSKYIQIKNSKQNSKENKILRELEKNLEDFLASREIGKVDQWIIEGLKTWVRVFLPNIFSVRLYPFDDIDDFHIMSNVKRNFFISSDIESIHYLFGSKPTIKVTMLGVITSVPKDNIDFFDPMKEFLKANLNEPGNEHIAVESGFRGVFRGSDGLEEMMRTCRYPRIMVQPIAIYRAVKPNSKLIRHFPD